MIHYTPQTLFFDFAIAAALCLLVLPRLASIADKIGLVDNPDKRKVHAGAIPVIGGVGMMIGLSLASILFVPLVGFRGVFGALVLLVTMGFLDDFKEVNHKVRFLGQICAVLLMVFYSNTVLLTFGNLLGFGPINFGILSILFTVFCIVGVINAINMMDGLDGLAGGISLVAFIYFSIIAHLNGQTELVLLNVAFCGALVGFLSYNLPPAKLFMGDAGSMAIGFILGYNSISTTHHSGGIAVPVTALLIMAVPIADTILVMGKRILNRKSPFHPDKTHLHHILMRFGFSKNKAVLTIIILMSAFGGFAIFGTLTKLPEPLMFGIFMGYFIFCLTVSVKLKKLYRAYLRGKLPMLKPKQSH